MRKNTVVGMMFLLIGIVIALFAIFIEYPARKNTSERCTLAVTSTVVGEEINSWSSGGESTYYYVPVVTYEVSGQTYTTTMLRDSSEHWEIGTKIELLVDPDFPIIFIPAEQVGAIQVKTNVPVLTFVFAVFFAGFGIFMLKTTGHSDSKMGKDGEVIIIRS